MDDFTFYEFFAGGGMARAGLGVGWRCLFANDLSPKKAAAYRANWGDADLHVGDVHALRPDQVPGQADVAWGSFPCQDLSLAGAGAGLDGARSGAFWGFWALIEALGVEGRAPRALVLENVCGALTSRGGRDFAAIGEALAGAGYRFGALVIDAALFVPQSRPRLFIVAFHEAAGVGSVASGVSPREPWHPKALVVARERLSDEAKRRWLWLEPAAPRANVARLDDMIEDAPTGVRWRSAEQTEALLALMAPLHRARVAAAVSSGERRVGTVYRRMRLDASGARVQRAEARFDGVAGCLRTPAGGSSRQTLLVIENGVVRSRLLSAREAARLMGLPDDYVLPAKYNDAYKLAGDGVAAPVVRFLAEQVLEPALGRPTPARAAG
ncbi:DNA (cytosine-5-)-methyltransferase [Methylopila jiangsuensis]|uniref:DNA (cytosine-5-)-methyltransferase n=1 Tax=Methylopila jiangsuensis TaxID=586230 RepID=A0A9W6N2Q4_9HYPH|nr:DNA cytosine methyltransferase [Methylopila jiangsuensis]MDR6284274.1 DNA (cytosine-5)-methyltransferase 1 [Methylopila jiangsuensis]GLK76209.1 DNA (cytosine-5-)-methyltransferase [Methylopila jiangsuensis]